MRHDLPGTDPARCAEPYRFNDYRAALGADFWSDDPALQAVLAHHGVTDTDRLARHGVYAATIAADGADTTDRPAVLPRLAPSDAFGQPHPEGVALPEPTRRVLADSLRAGLATEPSALLRYGLAYLGTQVGDAGVMCPLACTDGLVRALTELDCGEAGAAALAHVLSQEPDAPVHGAQFVTEVQGGSDAATNRVHAIPQGDGTYRLYGQKWFCSNVWAQYWAVTARPAGAPPGSRGVALFLVPRQTEGGTANGFRVERIKDKLGTRCLPTVELTLDGAVAHPVGELRAGLSNVVRIVLTTSRFWCALAGVGFISAADRIARAYADFRGAFGGPIARFPLVARTLDDLARDRRHLLAVVFDLLATWERVTEAERAGRVPDARDALRTRILVMLAKMTITRRATRRVHEAMMVLGGNGIEERFSSLPRLLRDAVILETWEGPHGLLTARLLLDIQRLGGDDPAALVSLLLGPGATEAEIAADGAALGVILGTTDPHERTLAFFEWTDGFIDRIGAVCWRAVAGR